MSSRRRVVIKLTNEQQNEIKAELGKEVTHVIFQLVGGSQLIVDAFEAPDTVDENCSYTL